MCLGRSEESFMWSRGLRSGVDGLDGVVSRESSGEERKG